MDQDQNCVYTQNTNTDCYIADRHYLDKLFDSLEEANQDKKMFDNTCDFYVLYVDL